MKIPYMHEDFLLENDYAKELYHEHAKSLPIIDYHCHLSPKDIAEDRQFENLTRIWLDGDHYKWRAMRTCGVEERFISGAASDWEKFEKWAETVPRTLRNPLYHWTHLELKKPFGILDRLLQPETARGIWEECNTKLAQPEFSARGILRRMNVEVVCTTDDPVDNLDYHKSMSLEKAFGITILPTFRPDRALNVGNPETFLNYVNLLSLSANIDIHSYADFLLALHKRHDYFHQCGCRLSDHGLETMYAEEYTDAEITPIFAKLSVGGELSKIEILKFKSAVLYELAVMDWETGWVQQFHLGAMRNNNSRMMQAIGPDTGYDSLGDFEIGRPLARFLDKLDTENELAKTILYNLNPRDNELMASMIGNFQDGSFPGKMQYGSAWWFLDQKDGITRQLEALSNFGILSQFVGMLTDSRSLLSYSRHEYFRRVLCNLLGDEIGRGILPNDVGLIGGLVKAVCYDNARKYFNFKRFSAAGKAGERKNGVASSVNVVEAE